MEKLARTTLIFFLLFLVNCAQNKQKVAQSTNQATNQNNTNLTEQNNEAPPPATKEIVTEEYKNVTAPPTPKTIKEHYYDGNFQYIINQTFTKNQLQDLYYKAFSYYGLARGIKNNPSLKKNYIEKSKKILKRVGIYTKNKELKARAILWYGLLKNVFPNKKLNNYEKISPFEYIKTRLKNTKSYDDALFYAGLVYENAGYYKSAKINYSMLSKIADNNFIYHYARRKVYPAKTISSYYLKNIDKKLSDLRKRKNETQSENLKPTNSPEDKEPSNEVEAISNDLLPSPDTESANIENQEFFNEEQEPYFLENDPNTTSDQQNGFDSESIYYEEDGESLLEEDPVKLGEELDVSFDGFLKNLSQKKEKNNQEVFILDDN